MTLQISIDGLEVNSLQSSGSVKTVLTSGNVMDENSFEAPNKVHRPPFLAQLDKLQSTESSTGAVLA